MYLNGDIDAITFASLDIGFDKSNTREVVSVSINQHPVFVREAVIQTVELTEEGIKKVKEAAELIKSSKERLGKIENEFEEVKAEIGKEVNLEEEN